MQHAGLFETVLNHAEEWLCSVGADGKKKLDIELPLPQDKARKEVLLSRGYRPDGAENWNLYDLTQPIPEPHFPDGFVLKRLAEIPESDFAALNTAIQQGFDHEGGAGPLIAAWGLRAACSIPRCGEIRAMDGLTFTGGDQPFYLSAGYQPHHTYAHFCKEY